MLTQVQGVTVTDRDNMVVATSRRGIVTSSGNDPCFLRIIVDGVALNASSGGGVDLRQLPPPDQVHSIEVFSGAASIPIQYGGTGQGKFCGLIAIWTR